MAEDPPQVGSKPTPTQAENDAAAAGNVPMTKLPDGSDLDPPIPPPATAPAAARPAHQTRAMEAEQHRSDYRTREQHR